MSGLVSRGDHQHKEYQRLDYVKKDKKGLRIGALTKLADIAGSAAVKEEYKLLAEAVHSVASRTCETWPPSVEPGAGRALLVLPVPATDWAAPLSVCGKEGSSVVP